MNDVSFAPHARLLPRTKDRAGAIAVSSISRLKRATPAPDPTGEGHASLFLTDGQLTDRAKLTGHRQGRVSPRHQFKRKSNVNCRLGSDGGSAGADLFEIP